MNGLPLAIPRQLALFERIVSRLLVKLAGAIQNIGLVDLLHPVARPISSIDTETASSPTPVKVITSLTIASASRAFCCSDRPGYIFTIVFPLSEQSSPRLVISVTVYVPVSLNRCVGFERVDELLLPVEGSPKVHR